MPDLPPLGHGRTATAPATSPELHPRHLRLEVTENLEATHRQLALPGALSAAGISLVVDDFGVSSSDLAHLEDLPAAPGRRGDGAAAGRGAAARLTRG